MQPWVRVRDQAVVQIERQKIEWGFFKIIQCELARQRHQKIHGGVGIFEFREGVGNI